MTKRILSLLLALSLTLGAAAYIALPASAAVSSDAIIDATLQIFGYCEGTYDSVNRNDNGAVSVGKLQWHAGRALELLKAVAAADPAAAQSALGAALYREVVTSGSSAWNSRVLSQSEAAQVSALLGGAASQSIQDQMARADIAAYIRHGQSLGITSAAAMVYYCDIENQYGQYGASAYLVGPVKARTGKSTIDSLDEFHTNLLQVTSAYHARRIYSYNFCRSLGWETGVSYDSTVTVPSYGGGTGVTADTTAPVIGGAVVTERTRDGFTIQFAASDNVGLSICTVTTTTNASGEDKLTQAAQSVGSVWSVDVALDKLSPNATVFTSEITVSDQAGNTARQTLQVTLAELYKAAGAATLRYNCAELGHRFESVGEPVPATCTQPGYELQQCSECGMCRVCGCEPALGHTDTERVVEPGCEQGGFTLRTCSVCGRQEQSDPTAPLGHSWSDWQTVRAVSGTQDGQRQRSCTRCGETETGVLAGTAHVHRYSTHTEAATCQQAGYTEQVCACGAVLRRTELPAAEHQLEQLAYTPASGTQSAYRTLRCQWCGETVTREVTEHLCAAFSDLDGVQWAQDAICQSVEQGLFTGTSATRFAPQDYMTRAMLVTVLYRLAGEPAAQKASGFRDVASGSWYEAAVDWARENGIVNGLDETHFDPNAYVTRQQLAAILYRYARYYGRDIEQGDDLSAYLDAGLLSDYAIGPWMWAARQGLLQGVAVDDTALLMPRAYATRAQTALILQRYQASASAEDASEAA